MGHSLLTSESAVCCLLTLSFRHAILSLSLQPWECFPGPGPLHLSHDSAIASYLPSCLESHLQFIFCSATQLTFLRQKVTTSFLCLKVFNDLEQSFSNINRHPGLVVKMQISVQQAEDSAFLPSSQVMPMFLVQRPQFEEQEETVKTNWTDLS